VAQRDDPQTVTLSTVMTPCLVCIPETASLAEAAARMRTYHIRRLVVVNAAGALLGLLALDDLLERVGEYQETLVHPMRVACRHVI
jgi:CBS domain-containing protein